MWSNNGMSMLPPGMDGRAHISGNSSADVGGGQDGIVETVMTDGPRSPTGDSHSSRVPERSSSSKVGNTVRSAFRSNVPAHTTIRAVTPEPQDNVPAGSASAGMVTESNISLHAKSRGLGIGPTSPKSSPRSVPGGSARRQGIVFNDSMSSPHPHHDTASTSSASPPSRQLPLRQRTHTMEGGVRQMSQSSTDSRRRVGSFSSSASQPLVDDVRQPPPQVVESVGFPSIMPARSSESAIEALKMTPAREKKLSTRRLIKRQSSRPTSPLISPPPSVDSLPLPVPTNDANKVLLLMKNLCGRMRGDIEYQSESGGPWHAGVAYIDEEKGSLFFDSGQNGPFHVTLLSDLRGCRVLPVDYPEEGKYCLEVVAGHPVVELLIRPLLKEEMDLWLAALLCWQQLRPMGGKLGNGKATSPAAPTRPELRRHGSSNGPSRNASIIKVGKILLWDKGLATSPRAIVKRPSTRDLRSPTTSWRRVSCILQDNGEFKLLTENDVTVLSVIELSQLSRCAIQQLDRTVLDEEFAIAIFPIYSSVSTQLSIFRPVYIALESRVHFEVWFVLLRAFAVPDVYRLDANAKDGFIEVTNLDAEPSGEIFRIEKTLSLRVTEAKIKPRGPALELSLPKSGKEDSLIGNYLAEVILDGEVRARTTTKSQTKNPFWREDCEFYDLPPNLPYLSIVLKRVDGNLDSLTHQLQASLGLPKTGNLTEVLCGSVDISLDQLDRGRDHEQWLQIYDDKQQSIGTMLVKIQHEELVVLLAKEYQPLSELLHRFPSGLTSQIAEVLPSSLRRLSEIFLNIFQVSGSAGEWLMALVEDEIDGIGNQASIKKYRFSNRLRSNESRDSASERGAIVRDMSKSLAGEANLLFRGNSLLTQSLEFHMRRLGKEYLEEVLMDKIFEINEINPNCEVDPSKIQPGEDLEQHWNHLISLTTELWNCIASSALRLPGELRHILKYVRAVAEDRYGDFLRTVRYTSVSGFLFLRFICPAILSPKLFGLLRDHPRPRAQRTFTLITKALQALANLTTFGQKESWMEPMNKFLNSHRQSVKDYIDSVCSIPAERGGYTLPASYSTPITILGRLSPTAREGFPSLPYLIDHARNFAALIRLWMDANPIGSRDVHQLVDGDLLIFNDLCSSLQNRENNCLARIEAVRSAENASQSPEDIVESLEHASLLETVNLSYGNSSSWMDSEAAGSNLRPPGSSGSTTASGDEGRSTRRGRETTPGGMRSSIRNGSGGHGGKIGRGILSGIMKMGGGAALRADSPEGARGGKVLMKERERERERDHGHQHSQSQGGGGHKHDQLFGYGSMSGKHDK